MLPTGDGSTGTSRQPSTTQPLLVGQALDLVASAGRRRRLGGQEGDARGVAPGVGQSQASHLPIEPVRDLEEDAGAVAGVHLGAGRARCSRLQRLARPMRTMSWLRRPCMSTTKATPHASWLELGAVQVQSVSFRGS